MAVQQYQDLIAWQRAMDLAETVYRFSQGFPQDKRFGLTNQIRRAAVSIASNIAEGQGRGQPADFGRFLGISNGSRQEVETQAILAYRLGFVSDANLQNLLSITSEVGRLLSGLRKSVG